VLEAGLQRRREEKVAFARLLTGLLGPLSGIAPEGAELLVAGYAETVFQLKYNYQYTPEQVRVLEKKRKEHEKNAQLMDRVKAMTVTGKM